MKFKLLLIFLFILSIQLVSSTAYQRGEPFDLKVPFEVNGSIASPSALCNVSIQYPNSSYFIKNATMLNEENGIFTHHINSSFIREVGDYCWNAFCCDANDCAAGYDCFQITPSGSDGITSGEGISLSMALFVIFIVGILFFVLSFKFENPIIRFSFIVFSIIILIIMVFYTMVIVDQTLGGFSNLIDGYGNFFFILKLIISIAFTALCLYGVWMAFRLFQIKRGLRD